MQSAHAYASGAPLCLGYLDAETFGNVVIQLVSGYSKWSESQEVRYRAEAGPAHPDVKKIPEFLLWLRAENWYEIFRHTRRGKRGMSQVQLIRLDIVNIDVILTW